jgi:endonuclease-3 related protein
MTNSKDLDIIYRVLHKYFGPRHWWPVITKGKYREFEIFLGAILTQQTSWTQVEKAIEKLERKNLIDPNKLASASVKQISSLIKPVAFYPTKAKRLKELAKQWSKIKRITELPILEARKEMLKLHGIGPETCDSILLYAFHRPTFVIDTYTKRLLQRYFGMKFEDGRKGYEQKKEFFESQLPRKEKLFNEYHALIVELGKNYCRTKPECSTCVLNSKCKKVML